jgi:hypothetical protein
MKVDFNKLVYDGNNVYYKISEEEFFYKNGKLLYKLISSGKFKIH